MTFAEAVAARRVMLTEGSVYERLRRDPRVRFDPDILSCGLIYVSESAAVLRKVHDSYLNTAKQCKLPIVALTDTWRANNERIGRSKFCGHRVNQDNAAFLRDLCETSGADFSIGGLMGSRGDAFKPQEALTTEDATNFHAPQALALREGGVDFLFAATLPALSEATGMALAADGFPAIISFVVRRDGTLLDKTPLAEAIERIDRTARPLGYGINCTHPSIALSALNALDKAAPRLVSRMLCFQANASPLSPEELDGIETLQTEPPEILAPAMFEIHRRYGIPLVGGCCGTDERHIAALGAALKA